MAEAALNLPETITRYEVATRPSIFLDMQRFADAQRVASMLANSSLVPEQFRGSVPNCVIALNLADRLQVDPFMMMQSMYVVHGRPGIEGKLAIALVDGTGRFSPLKFKFDGEGKTAKGVKRPNSCTAYATELRTGETIEGPPVSWEMAEAEGWLKGKPLKSGQGEQPSKWHTMPDLMFRYRAAMFFARVNCPGALLGLRTVEEIEDIDMVQEGNGSSFVMPKSKDTGDDPPSFDSTIPEGTDSAALDAFIARVAQANKKTHDEVKVSAAENPAEFWKTFTAWQTQERKRAEREAAKKEDPEQMAPAPCPNHPENTYTKKYCDGCPERKGCPAWGVNNG